MSAQEFDTFDDRLRTLGYTDTQIDTGYDRLLQALKENA